MTGGEEQGHPVLRTGRLKLRPCKEQGTSCILKKAQTYSRPYKEQIVHSRRLKLRPYKEQGTSCILKSAQT